MLERPIKALIPIQNLRHNLTRVKDNAPMSKIWAIVKANAYGHTLKAACEGFSGADGFGLLDLGQARLLREFGWRGPILMLEGFFHQDQLDEFVSLKADLVIHSQHQVKLLLSWYESLSSSGKDAAIKRLPIWLKMNSGMNRLGLAVDSYREIYHQLHGIGFQVHHLTHFANADELGQDPTVDAQLELFQDTIQGLDGQKSVANSAAILWHRHTLLDWCRPGIMLYGASPSGKFEDIQHAGLKPGMLLRSEVIAIQEIDAGQRVGYGGRYRATAPKKIAVIACGYADGYPRHAPDGTPVWVGVGDDLNAGGLCALAGRVSMDMITVDVTALDGVRVGSPVELWGEYVHIDHVAKASGTVGYELMCALAPRVPVYIER